MQAGDRRKLHCPPAWPPIRHCRLISFPPGRSSIGSIGRISIPSSLDPVPGLPPPTVFRQRQQTFQNSLYRDEPLRGARAETILRNPRRLMVSMAEITTRAISELSCIRPLRIVRMHGTGLEALGTDMPSPPAPTDHAAFGPTCSGTMPTGRTVSPTSRVTIPARSALPFRT
ncbi:hypothetical protein Rleg_5104 (plasmid) [Rhizobium leguminosarum bv. trifolii WSM1325]|uniref:Uncharacterized protein n=1 Tax=Rhizobium leguminosarum bv. trifolii (strain WSM1325) TaxID=395491 RepID=C6B5F9_RHILS|nr:hypothetical protein Rleg_5104 [Rhizobium leguminosarum bv. trifolii WSM1325]